MKSCTTCLFFECRKKKDLFMWLVRSPSGPSVKFHVQNIHTMQELKFTGNCLLGSRPILVFDKAFDAAPHWQARFAFMANWLVTFLALSRPSLAPFTTGSCSPTRPHRPTHTRPRTH